MILKTAFSSYKITGANWNEFYLREFQNKYIRPRNKLLLATTKITPTSCRQIKKEPD